MNNRFDIIPINIGQPAADDWRTSIQSTVEAMVGVVIDQAEPEPVHMQDIRSKVIRAARKALADYPSGPMLKRMLKEINVTPIGEVIGEPEPTEKAMPGMLRLMLLSKYPNWQDAIGAETVMAEVQKTVEKEVDDYWRDLIDRTVRGIFDMALSGKPVRGVRFVKDEAMEDVRNAVDPAVPDDAPTMIQIIHGKRWFSMAGGLRMVARKVGKEPLEPATGGAIKAIAEWSLAQVVAEMEKGRRPSGAGPSKGWRDRLKLATQMMVAADRQLNPEMDDDEIRQATLEKFERAFFPVAPDDTSEEDIPGPDGTTTRETVVRPFVTFRLALWTEDIDWYEPENKAEAREHVEQVLDDELAA